MAPQGKESHRQLDGLRVAVSRGRHERFEYSAVRARGTSMKAKRRINANDISNSSDLSNTFIVAITRQLSGIASRVRSGWTLDALGHECQWVRLARSRIGKSDRLARENREQLAERSVEVRAVQLIDDEPLVSFDGLEEMAGCEQRAVRSQWASGHRWSRRWSSPLSRLSTRSPAHSPPLAAASATASASVVFAVPGGPVRITCLPLCSAANTLA